MQGKRAGKKVMPKLGRNLGRSLARGASVLVLLAVAGYLGKGAMPGQDLAAAPEAPAPSHVTLLASGPVSEPAATALLAPVPALPPLAQPATALPAAALTPAPAISGDPVLSTVPAATADCAPLLDLTAEAEGMIGLVLTAPCHKEQRVVLSHAGLAVTARTTASGSLFALLPALETDAAVAVKFGDGQRVEAHIAVPEATQLRRFAVQWQGIDGFGIHALEGGASYGQPGDISAANPHVPLPGLPAAGGYLTLLGDSSTDLPLLAEVYTFPAKPETRVDLLVEAAVTPATCTGDLLGETVSSFGGTAQSTDLTVAMPGCDGVGDYLVLKNLAEAPKLAAAN